MWSISNLRFLRDQYYSAPEENRLIFFFSQGLSDYQINGHPLQHMSKARNNGKSAGHLK